MLTISTLRDETRTAMSTVSTGPVDIAQLLANARQARDLARSEAAEISRLLQAARTNLDNIMSEVRDTARSIAADEAHRIVNSAVQAVPTENLVHCWVENAISAEDGALDRAV